MKPLIRGLSHDHMDGCKSNLAILPDLYREANKPFPFQSPEEMIEFFQNNAVQDIPKCFGYLTGVMQSERALRMVAAAYIKHRAAQGYIYLEPKFAPQYHTAQMSMEKVVDVVFDELKARAAEHNVIVIPQDCIGREAPTKVGIENAKIVLKYDGKIIMDMACDESLHPPEKHIKAYKILSGTNCKTDCHAGEWVVKNHVLNYRDRLLDNLRVAVYNLGCDSIGHAIPLAYDRKLVDYVVKHQIRITMCPLSNLALGHIKDVKELRIDELLDAGVWLTLNPDDDLFLPEMDEVIRVCDEAYNFTPEQCRKLEANAIRPL